LDGKHLTFGVEGVTSKFSSFLEDKLDPSFSPYCDKHKTWQKTVKASNLTKKNFESCARKQTQRPSQYLSDQIARLPLFVWACLAYKPYFFSQRTIFFSHTKSANSTFSHGLSAKQAKTNRANASC